jgi:hypothetical protein
MCTIMGRYEESSLATLKALDLARDVRVELDRDRGAEIDRARQTRAVDLDDTP